MSTLQKSRAKSASKAKSTTQQQRQQQQQQGRGVDDESDTDDEALLGNLKDCQDMQVRSIYFALASKTRKQLSASS